jgi:hypothetical protein
MATKIFPVTLGKEQGSKGSIPENRRYTLERSRGNLSERIKSNNLNNHTFKIILYVTEK